jgi:hypothetical protein
MNQIQNQADLDNFYRARCAAVPVVILSTPDQFATQARIVANSKFMETAEKDDETIACSWDASRGLVGINAAGIEFAKRHQNLLNDGYPDLAVTELSAPEYKNLILFIHNAHRFLCKDGGDTKFIQSVCNARDSFKTKSSMLFLMGPQMTTPIEIKNDAMVVDESLPSRQEIRDMAISLADNVGLTLTDEQLDDAVAAVRGLSRFAAEQLISMNLSSKAGGIRSRELWEMKRKQVEQCPAISIDETGVHPDQLAGIDAVMKFGKQLADARSINGVIFIDEIEKDLAGAMGDTSGVSQDALKVVLETMQDMNQTGLLFVGGGGTGKSACAKSIAKYRNKPTIKLDFGAAKGPHVGDSQAMIREAIKTALAVTDGNALWVATCNKLAALPPELKRRFKLGTWYFEIPDDKGRKDLWKLKIAKEYRVGDQAFKVSPENSESLPPSEGWTGAEIESCCELSATTGLPLTDVSSYIVPISISDAPSIAALRQQADGRWLSSRTGGVYKIATEEVKTDRASKLAD